MKFLTVAGFLVLAGPLCATTISYVTVDTSTSPESSNIYDSVTGLSQHIGSCFIAPTTNVGPCATLTSTPATNTPGLTAASVGINATGYDPDNGVSGFAAASAYANLASGMVGVLASGLPCSPVTPLCGDSGNAIAELQDGLTFVNTTGSVQDITMSWSFDGIFSSNATSPADPSETITSLFCFSQGTGCFGNAGTIPHGPISTSLFEMVDSNGTVTNTSPSTGWVSTSVIDGVNGASETFEGVFAVPTGTSSESLNAYLNIGCEMSTCDFSHTGAFSIGALPGGVSFTSSSGVLLSATAPEPGSWLLALAGVGCCLLLGKRITN